jgi:hypothetical protein
MWKWLSAEIGDITFSGVGSAASIVSFAITLYLLYAVRKIKGFRGVFFGPFVLKYPYWTTQIYLELVDDYGHTLWTFPEVSAVRDLLTAVKYQVSGVKDLLDDLLNDESA